MLNKLKRRRILSLALIPITFLLSIATGWLYHTVQSGYGANAAVLALTVVTVVILSLVCKGIQYAAAIEKTMQGQITTLIDPSQARATVKPFTVEILGQVLYKYSDSKFSLDVPTIEINDGDQVGVYELNSQPHKRRGKQSRFPISKITKAVLKWEQRDSQFTSINLTEFLEQEFGSGPDGILLMAPTTFYDWRRRVLSNLESQNKHRSTASGVEAH